jgi:hypothetical protein
VFTFRCPAEDVDWGVIRELLTESCCVLAPKKLIELVERPAAPLS